MNELYDDIDLIQPATVATATSIATTLITDLYNETAARVADGGAIAAVAAAAAAAATQFTTSANLLDSGYVSTPNTCHEDYAPEDDHNFLDFWLSGVLLNVIGVVGILGNVLSMVILSRPQMRSSINYLLIGLARCDTVLIVTSMLLFGFRSIYPYTGYLFIYNYYIYPQIAPYVFPLATASQTASIYLTLMVSLERYVAVCHPLRAVSEHPFILIYYVLLNSGVSLMLCCKQSIRIIQTALSGLFARKKRCVACQSSTYVVR